MPFIILLTACTKEKLEPQKLKNVIVTSVTIEKAAPSTEFELAIYNDISPSFYLVRKQVTTFPYRVVTNYPIERIGTVYVVSYMLDNMPAVYYSINFSTLVNMPATYTRESADKQTKITLNLKWY